VVYSRGSWPFMAQESTMTGWEGICFGICLVFFFGISCIYLKYIYIYTFIYIHLCGYIIPHVVTGMMSSRGSYPQIAASFRLNTIYPRYPQLYTPLYTTRPIYSIYPKHSQTIDSPYYILDISHIYPMSFPHGACDSEQICGGEENISIPLPPGFTAALAWLVTSGHQPVGDVLDKGIEWVILRVHICWC
jgi:hypothetical protein